MPGYGANPAAGLDPRNCEVCGSSYQPYRDSQLTCGNKCYRRSKVVVEKQAAYNKLPEVRDRKNVARTIAVNPCQVTKNLRQNLTRYGITLEEYEALRTAQGNRCAICGDQPDPNGKGSMARLHVDHHHATGRNRALLCARCNVGIGYFREDPKLLQAAVEYLERHRQM